MVNYEERLKKELVEQFRGKPNIDGLMEVIGAELQAVYDFYKQLGEERDVYSAVGKQLDGVGDIAVLNRIEAAQLAGNPIPFDVLDDDTYRRYLIYKILKNTCETTYPDIIKAFRMFWDRPLYYSEDPEQPATMIFDTGEIEGNVDTTPLFKTPLIRAAGVTLKLFARTSVKMDTTKIHLMSGLGYADTVTDLPFLERNIDYGYTLRVGVSTQSIAQSDVPPLKPGRTFKISLNKSNPVRSVLETPMGSVKLQT